MKVQYPLEALVALSAFNATAARSFGSCPNLPAGSGLTLSSDAYATCQPPARAVPVSASYGPPLEPPRTRACAQANLVKPRTENEVTMAVSEHGQKITLRAAGLT